MATEIETINARLGRIEAMLMKILGAKDNPYVAPQYVAIDAELAQVKATGGDIAAYYKNKAKADPEYRGNNGKSKK